jgi:hypothetical protein
MKWSMVGLALVASMTTAMAAEIIVLNTSETTIHKLFVSPSKTKQWGPDQLGNHSLKQNERFTLRNVPLGTYNLKIVDEDDYECELEAVNLTTDGMTWTLTDELMEKCE